MAEHIAQMGPMLVLAGLMAGWLAETVSRAGGYGLILDMFLGLIGSVVAGSTVWVVIFSDAGMPGMLLIGCGGAALAIIAQRTCWRSARQGHEHHRDALGTLSRPDSGGRADPRMAPADAT